MTLFEQLQNKVMKTTFFYFLGLILLLSCSSNNDSPESPEPILSAIEITSSGGSQLDLAANTQLSLRVMGKDQIGRVMSFSDPVVWSADNANIEVEQNGRVTGKSVGASTVTARVKNLTDNFDLSVVDSSPQAGTFLYVSDAANFNNGPWKILKYDEDGGNPTTFIDDQLAWPQDIVFLENQNVVLISNLSSGRITKHNAATGNYIEDFASVPGGPTRMEIGPDNTLYVLQWAGTGNVLRFNLNGTSLGAFTSRGVTQAIGMDWDTEGNLYVSSFADANVRKFDADGNDAGLFINMELEGPTNVRFDSNGEFLVLDWRAGTVVRFDSDGNRLGTFASGLVQAEGIDFFADGSVLIGHGENGSVKHYGADGSFISSIIPSGAGGLIRPNAVRIRIVE